MLKIGVVGCGNLGSSLIKGIHESKICETLIGSKRDLNHGMNFNQYPSIQITTDNSELLRKTDIVVLALKPFAVLPFLEAHKNDLDSSRHIIVSTATGVMTAELQNVLGEDFPICRAMPNTAATIGESMTLLSFNKFEPKHQETVHSIFKGIGEVQTIDESLMDAATILGACGVAYVLRFMRAMIQGGIEVGFDAKTATQIVAQTMIGASELVIQNESHPEQEIDKVTTPRGCTIVGLNEMEHAGFSSALIKGIVASYNKIAQ